MKRIVMAAVAAASLCVPAAAGAHATVNAMQPQGKSLAGARQSFVVRVPNEHDTADTYQVSLFVPPALQEAIGIGKKPGWRVRLARKGTAVEKVTWTAVRKSSGISPRFYDEFPVRWQNPATAQRICFWIYQTYGNWKRSRWDRVETVKWTGAASSETPASCINVEA